LRRWHFGSKADLTAYIPAVRPSIDAPNLTSTSSPCVAICASPSDLAEILPKYRDLSIPEMIRSTVTEPLAALDRAIQAKDISQFTVAYGQLTVSCNSCHQSYDRAVIVIQPPTVSSFPDQDFGPSMK
jgi:hypothetical protein